MVYDIRKVLTLITTQVDTTRILPELMALIDFLKPDVSASNDPNLHDICRPEWIWVVNSVWVTLRSMDRRVVQGNALLQMIARRVNDDLAGIDRASPAYTTSSTQVEATFEEHLNIVLNAAVKMCQVHFASSWWNERIKFLAQVSQFSKQELDAEMLAQSAIPHESLNGVWRLQSKTAMDVRTAYKIALVASIRFRPCVAGPGRSNARNLRELCINEWNLLDYAVTIVLRNSAGLNLEAKQLYKTLMVNILRTLSRSRAQGRAPRMTYGETYNGRYTFKQHLELVVRTIVFRTIDRREAAN